MCGRYLVQHWKEACAAKGTDFLYDDDDDDGHLHDDHCEENNDDVI